jgi:citronellol/citronellal dehydrogenase
MSLSGRVAIVTGASRGIGRAIALKLAREGADVVLAAKTMEADARLPGTLPEVAAEIEKLCLAVRTNVRQAPDLQHLVQQTLTVFGRIDILVNNAGALWWHPVADTPIKKFDLVMEVNVRASFALAHLVLPAMLAQRWGHIINLSPPIDFSMLAGRVGYLISKYGMTMLTFGLAAEVKDSNVAVHSLWPRTIIESQATINFGLGDRGQWRKADIMADAAYELARHEPSFRTGKAWLDEEVLWESGVTDFSHYSCVPGSEPAELTWDGLSAGRSPHR